MALVLKKGSRRNGNAMQKSAQDQLQLHANGDWSRPCDPHIKKYLVELIDHTFLPKMTPVSSEANLEEIEISLLHLAHSTFVALNLPELAKVEVMFENWKRVQVKSSMIQADFVDEFQTTIGNLNIGDSAVIYVQKQNCTVLLTKLDEANMRCMTYRSSLLNETIMSTIGSLQVSFPETDDVILNQDFLRSQTFALQLFELCTTPFEMAMPTLGKDGSGNECIDSSNVPKPFLVSDWLVGQLVPGNLPSSSITVTKKMRDEVRCHPSTLALPFRRSGMWTSIKTTLALKIRETVKSEENGNILYKTVMLRLLADLGMYYSQENETSFDLASQVLAKLGRRVSKLQKLPFSKTHKLTPLAKTISSAKDKVLQYVLQVSSSLRNKITNNWRKVVDESTSSSSVNCIPLTPAKISSDLRHEIDFLDRITALRALPPPPALDKPCTSIDLQLVQLQRYPTFQSFSPMKQGSTDFERKVWLHDMEILIKTRMHEITNPPFVRRLFFEYVPQASSFYKNQADPSGYSQMLLCSLKLIQALDRNATGTQALLLEYKSGIRERDFDMLLLPHLDDMNLLEELLTYFRARDEAAKYPATLSSSSVDKKSFCVRYAINNSSMVSLRASILEETERHIQKKYNEVDGVRSKCEELQKQISRNRNCHCTWEVDQRGYPLYKKSICARCNLESELGSLRKSVGVYGRPLPQEEYLQHAVVFELLVPEELTSLRDALAHLNFHILLTSSFNDVHPATTWETYMHRHPPGPESRKVKLWSNHYPASESYLTPNPNVLHSPNSSFVIYEGMDCIYFQGPPKHNSNAKELCTFHIRNTSDSDMKLYKNLQCTLADTIHTQNKIIASSYNCHRDLTVAEFVSFGSLRSGHRIQIRNLFRSISNRTLSLEKEPVVALIMQALWQLGPREEDGVRESHADFIQNEVFTKEFLVLLENVVDHNEQNYSNPYILLVIIIATSRITELNEQCRQEGYQLLHKCRQLLSKWAERIEKYISDELVKSSSPNLKSLKLLLLQTTICSAFTYKISPSLLDTVTQQPNDILHWLQTISRMHYLISEECDSYLSTFAKSLLMTARAVPLELEKTKLFSNASEMSDCLHSFATQKWNKANDCILQEPWRKHETHPNVFVGKYLETITSTQHILSFDFHQGSFLVDGYPSSSLPSQITDHSLYKLWFSGIKFKIQRDSQTFRTVDRFHGNHYEFELIAKSATTSELIIRKIDACQNVLELISPSHFNNIIAPTFITKYTHWLDPRNKIVYFNRRPTEDSHYDLPPDFTLAKTSGSSWIFKNLKTEKYLLSINSEGFDHISTALARLEERVHINVVLDKETSQLTALLPRYQLSFNLNNEGHLCSVEYPDYKISCAQVFGTLVGLQQGILMENINNGKEGTTIRKQLALIPHSHIEIIASYPHQTTVINLATLRSPKFFAYEVDPVLQRLVGGKSKAAWLYLAALHGATSSSLPDPFTGLTGTEMSMWILQSAMVWSCSPYDDESIETLKTIRGFSPKRSYCGASLGAEVIDWPQGLKEVAAFDGFEIIVDHLLEESSQLAFLFPRSPKLEEALKTTHDRKELRTRSYLRSLPFYNRAASVKEDLIGSSYKIHIGTTSGPTTFSLRTEHSLEIQKLLSISQIRYLNNVIHSSVQNALKKVNLVSWIITDDPLQPPIETKSVTGIPLKQLFKTEVGSEWLRIYKYARSGASKTSQEESLAWSALLSAMAYMGDTMGQIIMLHLISQFADLIQFPPVPEYTTPRASGGHSKSLRQYSKPSANKYSREEIKSILNSHKIEFRARHKQVKKNKNGEDEDEDLKVYNRAKSKYDSKQEKDFEAIVTRLEAQWPCDQVEDDEVDMFSGTNCDYREALKSINEELNFWYNNYKLKLFFEEVETLLKTDLRHLVKQKLKDPSPVRLYNFGHMDKTLLSMRVVSDSKEELNHDLEEFLKSLPSGNQLRKSKAIFESGKLETSSKRMSLEKHHESIVAGTNTLSQIISSQMTRTTEKEILLVAGIAPRITPLFLARLLTNEKIKGNQLIYNYAGALVIHFVNLKRIRRCIRLESKETTCGAELKGELANKGHENWSPAQYPEWLLLELELDLMIRPVQVEVARQMMKMPNGGNGTMQLNMGEGKTSVIVPMLCSSLSNEKTLCRVTVLNSIFKTNFNILTFAVGGLLNRRLFTVPCRRDIKLSSNNVHRIEQVYKECLREKGVCLTLPEYRLSFRLKIADSIIKQEEGVGLELLKVENWLRDHARDILDESDELLSVKYQLVYTIGTQIPVDGGSMRWKTCQDMLRIIQQLATNLSRTHGSRVIEFDKEGHTSHPEQFAYFRILKESCHQQLCGAVADIILSEIMLPASLKQAVRKFLTEEDITQALHNEVMTSFEDCPELLRKILMYSGYIRRGILTLALTKRWRVEFGVNPRGNRRMAVPFRAKDVAAERTEFGHPDLAIILTHLSYYYSGLSDCQLMECFACLKKKIDPEIIYRSWLQPISNSVPPFLLNYRGLNINDMVERSQVFDVLRKHKAVIDFWLDHKVFPRESKQFPGKIVMTAWDLCYERNKYPTTGFSGTNDSSMLLPLTISQQDLPQLLLTNENLEKVLLQPENKRLKGLRMGVTCKEILEKMMKDKLRVLIDAGALMLDCDNEQVAQLWLDVDLGIEATVYFNKDNEIMVKSRDECQKANSGSRHKTKDIPLELSPFGGRLGQCGVFLDDQHTRATDLKFPIGSKACVTVGARMRRDKLMQACMRMRKLGQGHSVSFYLSHEVYDKVTDAGAPKTSVSRTQPKAKTKKPPTTADVISWVSSNTKQFNEDGLPYWAVAGKNYVQKLSAEDLFPLQKHLENNAPLILANQCEDDEVNLLTEMYGTYTQNELLSTLIPMWFAQTKEKLRRRNSSIPVNPQILLKVDSTCSSVVARCRDHALEKMHLACLVDEEQEKELEKEAETEEEREVNRPSKMDEVTPSLHPNVVKVIRRGLVIKLMPGIQRLSDVFKDVSFNNEVQPDCWVSNQVFATDDFISVIKIHNSKFKTDLHLRPVEYLAIRKCPKPQVLLLSSFEANALMPDFRQGKAKLRLHMFTPRTFEKQDLLLNNRPLQLPLVSTGTGTSLSAGSEAMAALLVASGNLYFDTMEEQRAFARFLGLVPQPWTDAEATDFENGLITKTGFRLLLPPEQGEPPRKRCKVVEGAKFSKDPTTLVKTILSSRHAVVGEVTHVMKLMDKNVYVEID